MILTPITIQYGKIWKTLVKKMGRRLSWKLKLYQRNQLFFAFLGKGDITGFHKQLQKQREGISKGNKGHSSTLFNCN